MRRWVKGALIGTGVLAVAAAVAGAVVWTRLPEIAADRASRAAQRKVTIGGLRLSPGRWIGVELRDAEMANLPGGTKPAMATLKRLTGEVALWPLLHGTVLARNVTVEGGDLLLERVGGQPNWRNGPKKPEGGDDGRSGFPTLLGAVFRDVAITFRTSSGSPLVTVLKDVTLDATAPDSPAHLAGQASYHDAPVALDLRLGSFDQLHDAAAPFPTDVRLTSKDTEIHFVGTMTRPLDVDGVDGKLTLNAPTPDALEKVAGADPAPAPPLRLDGALQHDKTEWALRDAKGALGAATLEAGTLGLREGSTDDKTPDRITLDLRFGPVDADRLMAQFGSGGGGGGSGGDGGFVPQAAPNPEVSAKIAAASLAYDKVRLAAPRIEAALEPGVVKLDQASFGALGGQVHVAGQVKAEGKLGAVTATVTGTGLEVADLRTALGIGTLPLTGRVDVHAVAAGRGADQEAAMRAGQASLVATMAGGSVSAQVIELASTDVTGLLRSSREMVPLQCALLVGEVRGGVATLGPVRLRSGAGTVVARGQVNLLRETVDLVVASEARTTGALALDVPVRVSGRLSDPSVSTAGSAAGQAALAGGSVAGLAAGVRPFAQRSPCAR